MTHIIYVSDSGSDTVGNGNENNPYRQPQRALNDIPAGASGEYIVQLSGTGFEVPVWNKKTENAFIYIVGDRNNPDIKFGPAPSFSAASGKKARQRANIGSYGVSIGDNTHWVESDNLSASRAALDSASPDLDVSGSYAMSGANAVHPFVSEMTAPSGKLFGNFDSSTYFYMVGVHITTGFLTLHNTNLLASKCSGDAITFSGARPGFNVFETSYWTTLDNGAVLYGSLFKNPLNFGSDKQKIDVNGAVFKYSGGAQISWLNRNSPNVNITDVDIEGSGTFLKSRYGEFYLQDINIVNTIDSLLDLERHSIVYCDGNIDGYAVSGNLATLADGSQCHNLASSVGSGLNIDGDFAIVGATTASISSDLPLNDYSSSSSENCFAS